jgi:hypothetical protein
VSLKELLLLVSLLVKPLRGGEETFPLRLLCDSYPTFPPDVQFVNPATGVYVLGQDAAHIVDLRAASCWVHLNYSGYPPSMPMGRSWCVVLCAWAIPFAGIIQRLSRDGSRSAILWGRRLRRCIVRCVLLIIMGGGIIHDHSICKESAPCCWRKK